MLIIKRYYNRVLMLSILVTSILPQLSYAICDVNVMSSPYSAKGDGVNDDTNRIQDAIDATPANGTVCFPGTEAGYLTTDTIFIPPGVSAEMDGYILLDAVNKPAVVVGDADVANSNVDLILAVKKQVRDWSNENTIGIRLVNTQQSSINIKQAERFTIGVQAYGHGRGFVFNTVKLGTILDNKIGLELSNEDTLTTGVEGYVNENIFINGKFRVGSNIEAGVSRYGIRITSHDGTYTNNNNNLFIKPSFELKHGENQQAIPVVVEHGNRNRFESCRSEGNAAIFALVKNGSEHNVFDIGLSLDDSYISDESDSQTSFLSKRGEVVLAKTVAPIYMSGSIRDGITHYQTQFNNNIRNWYHFSGLHMVSSNSVEAKKAYFKTNSTLMLGDDYVDISADRGVGVFIDTSNSKRFVLRRDYVEGQQGHIRIHAFGQDGNQLIGSDPAYVAPTQFSSNFSNAYSSSKDSRDYYFTVHDEVKKVALRLSGTQLKSFSIISLDGGAPRVWPGYEESFPRAHLAETIPLNTCEAGRIVFNAEPSQGENLGWICLGSNVWNEFGLIE